MSVGCLTSQRHASVPRGRKEERGRSRSEEEEETKKTTTATTTTTTAATATTSGGRRRRKKRRGRGRRLSWLLNLLATRRVYLMDGSAQTIRCAAIL